MVAGPTDSAAEAPASGESVPAPPVTTAVVSARMSRQATKDTAPELALRRELHRRGYRYRKEWTVPGMSRRRMDIAFTRRRVAVFVDGCFWHACPIHATAPRANAAWWAAKLDRNVVRDRATDDHLSRLGWIVVRVWEHEDPREAADRIVMSLTSQSDDRVERRLSPADESDRPSGQE